MKYENQELLSEFYEIVKQVYPELSLEQVKEICFGPWMFLKDEIESGNLFDVRYEFFGVFKVLEGKVKALQNFNDKRLANGTMKPETHAKYERMYENYFKRKSEED